MATSGRIAVVDDEDNIRETVGFALRREGYPVELPATDGEAPGTPSSRSCPASSSSTSSCREMDGLELCRRLRGRLRDHPDHLPHLPRRRARPRPRPRDRRRRLPLQAVLDARAPRARESALPPRRHRPGAKAPRRRRAAAARRPELDLQRYAVALERPAAQPDRHRVHDAARPRAPPRPREDAQAAASRTATRTTPTSATAPIDTHIKRVRQKFEEGRPGVRRARDGVRARLQVALSAGHQLCA